MFCARAIERLGEVGVARLLALVTEGNEDGAALLALLKRVPGAVGLDSLPTEVNKLNDVRRLGLPEELMTEENLALLQDGTPRDFVELSLRVGRRPWEVRHLEFDCVQWHDVDIEAPDGSVQRRRYPFLVSWMQKVRRRHKLPLHLTDVEVISRQQDHVRREFPQWFDTDGQPLPPRLLLFPTPRLTRANKFGERPYDSSISGYWLDVWMDRIPQLLDEHDQAPAGSPRRPAACFVDRDGGAGGGRLLGHGGVGVHADTLVGQLRITRQPGPSGSRTRRLP